MRTYRLFDTKEKTYLNEDWYATLEQAKEDKDAFLAIGNYPDEPHNVIQIHEFKDNDFVQDVTEF